MKYADSYGDDGYDQWQKRSYQENPKPAWLTADCLTQAEDAGSECQNTAKYLNLDSQEYPEQEQKSLR